MTQSLMFIPVIRCEEEDLYFIVEECIEAALRLLLRLPASLRNIFPPPEARCNPCMEETQMPSANCWSAI